MKSERMSYNQLFWTDPSFLHTLSLCIDKLHSILELFQQFSNKVKVRIINDQSNFVLW